ncbi:hypothetical protein M3D75_03745 [Microbacterium enclense]|uniref:hypothetical protein n=1 Tax=Microbacterium enclense TaxID=993073 RepID=UPI0021A95328|nr:hypothetical protein [Microbacterium enclense]MCT2085223.1 hypothetical protein [Microbacterium enclense]
MDENVIEARLGVTAPDTVQTVDGVSVASLHSVVSRLRLDYPGHDPIHIETVVLREWEAFSAGRPLVIPTAVEDGAREILDQRSV